MSSFRSLILGLVLFGLSFVASPANAGISGPYSAKAYCPKASVTSCVKARADKLCVDRYNGRRARGVQIQIMGQQPLAQPPGYVEVWFRYKCETLF